MVLALAVLALPGCAALEHGHDSALLLGDVQAGQGPSRLKAATAEPERVAVRYARAGRRHRADVYRPGERAARGTLVVIHGFTRQGRRDPRLVAFARSMARTGFVVVAPDIEGPRTLAVGLDDARAIRDALAYTAAGADGHRRGPIGIMAYSFAVGPTVIAAADPVVAADVDVLVGVGGYYDLRDAITYVSTGVDPATGRRTAVPAPRREGKWLVLLSQLPRLPDPEDRRLLRAIAERRLARPDAPVRALVERLGSGGRAVYELVTNEDPGRVDALIGALPSPVRAEINGLDLARRDLSGLKAEVVLIHGEDDDVIPIAHSERLQAAIGEDQACLYRAGGLQHVDVLPGFLDGLSLWRAGIRILELTAQARD